MAMPILVNILWHTHRHTDRKREGDTKRHFPQKYQINKII